MTKDQWTELQSLLRQLKAAEKTLDRFAAKTETARKSVDELGAKVRAALPADD